METRNEPLQGAPSTEETLRKLITGFRQWLLYCRSKWKVLSICLVIGLIAGFIYKQVASVSYRGEITFAFESESNSNSMPGFGNVFGVGGASKVGLFDDVSNIMWFYTSDEMIRKSLLQSVTKHGQKILMLNWVLNSLGIREDIKKNERLKNAVFSDDINPDDSLTKEQNAVLNLAISAIKNKHLRVSLEPNSENIVSVSMVSKDEELSKVFVEKIVEVVSNYYINHKTSKTQRDIALLQKKVDSLNLITTAAIYQVASSYDDVPYANPYRMVTRTTPQKKQLDVDINKTIYAAVLQDLENNKALLQRQTPLIQIIDVPRLPLPNNNKSLLKYLIICTTISLLLGLLAITIRRYYLRIMK